MDNQPTAAYAPLTETSNSIAGSGFRVTFGRDPYGVCRMPTELTVGGREVLSSPAGLFVYGAGDRITRFQYYRTLRRTPRQHRPIWSTIIMDLARLPNKQHCTVESDGTLSFVAHLSAVRDFGTTTSVWRFHCVPRSPSTSWASAFLLAIRRRTTPGTGQGPYNSFWIGNVHAGLHVKLLGSTYEGPMQTLPPEAAAELVQ